MIRLKRLFQDKNRLSVLIRIAIIFILFTILFIFLYNNKIKPKKKVEAFTRRSVLHEGSSGIMALKEFLEQYDFNTENIYIPIMKFAKRKEHEKGIIMMIEPESAFNLKNYESLFKLVDEGFTLMFFSGSFLTFSNIFDLYENKGATGLNDTPGTAVLTIEAENKLTRLSYDKYGIWRDKMPLELKDTLRFDTGGNNVWHDVAGGEEGSIIIERNYGSGKIVLVSDSSFISNYNIGNSNNGVFVMKLIDYYAQQTDSGKIYFDEYSHGFHRKMTLLFFISKPEYFAFVFQIILVILLFFFLKQIKFGQFHYPVKDKKEEVYYFSEGISGLLAKRKYTPDVYTSIVNNITKLSNVKQTLVHHSTIANLLAHAQKHENKRKNRAMIIQLFKIIKKHKQSKKTKRSNQL